VRSLDDDLALRTLVHLCLLAGKHAKPRHAPTWAYNRGGRADGVGDGRSHGAVKVLLQTDLLLEFDDLLGQSSGGVGLLLEEVFHACCLRLEQLAESQLVGSAQRVQLLVLRFYLSIQLSQDGLCVCELGVVAGKALVKLLDLIVLGCDGVAESSMLLVLEGNERV
jgi:hypothetical protein